MENLKKFKITEKQNLSIKGGRRVVKEDLDGDGRWDVKTVYDRHGLITKVKFRG